MLEKSTVETVAWDPKTLHTEKVQDLKWQASYLQL